MIEMCCGGEGGADKTGNGHFILRRNRGVVCFLKYAESSVFPVPLYVNGISSIYEPVDTCRGIIQRIERSTVRAK